MALHDTRAAWARIRKTTSVEPVTALRDRLDAGTGLTAASDAASLTGS